MIIYNSGDVIHTDNPSGYTGPTGTGVVIAWNKNADHTDYTAGTHDDISKSPASATAEWRLQHGVSGIVYANGANTGFIPVSGVTVTTPLVDAVTPTIDSQPKDATVAVGDSATLSVTASVSDGGALTYQWYFKGATDVAVPGATGSSIKITPQTAGTQSYYVVITNTNSGATGNKTATATSNTATVTTTPVCQIGSTTYASLNDALAAITTSAQTTIKLLTDITHPDGCALSNKKITFYLNGKDLLFTGGTGVPALKLTNSTIDYTGTGNFKVISTGHDGLNISGGSCTLTYAETSASAGWQNAVYCCNGGKVTVNGNVTATNNNNNGGITAYGVESAITVNGDVSSEGTGASANAGGDVTVNGNITAGTDAIYADGGVSVTVTGNVATTGVDYSGIYTRSNNVKVNVAGIVSSDTGWGIYAESGTILVGSVKAKYGVEANNSGTNVTVDGAITAPIYIYLNGKKYVLADGKTDASKSDYLKYTDGISTVWVKDTTPPATYAISASTLTSFGSLPIPYTQPAAQTATITNTGTGSVTLNQPTAKNYIIGTLSTTTLAAGAKATFTVQPKANLPAGNYNEAIIISGSDGANASVLTSFTVNKGTDIDAVSQSSALKAWVENGTLHVSGLTVGQAWRVYNVAGVLIISPDPSKGGEEATIPLPGHGVFIVQSGNRTVKVVSEP